MQKKCNKIEEILRQFTEGVTKNPSLDVELILIICFYLIEQSLDTMMIKDTPDLNEFTVQEYSLTKDDLKKYDVQRTFLIQEGAASGKSICKHFYYYYCSKPSDSQAYASKSKEECVYGWKNYGIFLN